MAPRGVSWSNAVGRTCEACICQHGHASPLREARSPAGPTPPRRQLPRLSTPAIERLRLIRNALGMGLTLKDTEPVPVATGTAFSEPRCQTAHRHADPRTLAPF